MTDMGTEKTLYLPSSVQTGGVALPRQAESAIMQEQQELAAELYEVTGKLEHYTYELQHAFDDPYLSIVLAKPNADPDGPLRANYYHIIRREPNRAVYIKVIEGPNGEWRDLDSSVLTMAAEDDLWNDRTQRQLEKQRRRAARAAQLDRERAAMERAGDFDERLYNATHATVSIPKAVE